MQYMLMICGTEGAEPEPGFDIAAATEAWVSEMDGRGVRNNEVLICDGPFAETKEQMFGFDLLECADLDEAIEVASKHPVARYGMIEVRPFWPLGAE